MDFINMVVRVLEPVPAVIGLKARRSLTLAFTSMEIQNHRLTELSCAEKTYIYEKKKHEGL